MSATTTTAGNILKTRYIGKLQSAVNNEALAYQMFNKRKMSVSGADQKIALHVRRNWGIGFGGENIAVPAAGNQGYLSATITPKKVNGRVGFTLESISKSRDDAGAFARIMSEEMTRSKNDIVNTLDKHMCLDGTGSLTTTPINAAVNPIVVDTIQHLEIGMVIDIIDQGTNLPVANGTARTITAIDPTTLDVTLSGAGLVTTAAGDYVVQSGSLDSSGNSLVLQGLDGLINTTNIQSVNTVTYPEFTSYVKDAGGANFSEALAEEAFDNTQIRAGKVPDSVIVHHTHLRQYKSGLESQRRVVNTVEVVSGRKALEFAYGSRTVGIMAERYAIKGRAYGVSRPAIEVFEEYPIDFMDEDGQVLMRTTTGDGKTNFEAVLVGYLELVILNRINSFRIENLAT